MPPAEAREPPMPAPSSPASPQELAPSRGKDIPLSQEFSTTDGVPTPSRQSGADEACFEDGRGQRRHQAEGATPPASPGHSRKLNIQDK